MRTKCYFRPLALLWIVSLLGCVAADHTYPRNFSDAWLTPTAAAEIIPLALDDTGKPASVTGVWQGISQADCITINDPGRWAAMQNITLTLIQQGDVVTGYYKCSYGNEVCRNLDEKGAIRNGSLERGWLLIRIMLEDGSMCFFTGRPLQGVLEGRYSCLQGAGLVERGAFEAVLNY